MLERWLCRLCLVEIDGRAGYPASCTTPVAEGMSVHPQTEALTRRRGVMELYISDHPARLPDPAPPGGDCELQDTAGAVGLREVRYGYRGGNHLDAATDASNPYFEFDPTKCVVCSRCVRACDEVQNLRPHHRRTGFRVQGRGQPDRSSAPSAYRAAPASVLPDLGPAGKESGWRPERRTGRF